MPIPRLLLLLPLTLALAGQPACAQPYKWVDAQGRTHYGDRPPAEAKARPVTVPINTYTGTPVLSTGGRPAAKAAVRESLVIYTTPTCGYCNAAKAHMGRRGIPYTERDITISESNEREFRQQGGRGVPLIVAGSRTLKGYSEASLEELLKVSGY
jgi:glutaredoxin